jgi:hypothetical protein
MRNWQGSCNSFAKSLTSQGLPNMKYRGIEYGIVEGAGGHMWGWSTLIGGAVKTGRAHSKQAATVAAEKAIDRALALKKVRLVPPERSD